MVDRTTARADAVARRADQRMDITASEQERRADLVAAARRASELAGWRSDDTTRAVQDAYISGYIDLDDLVAQAQAVAGTARDSAGMAGVRAASSVGAWVPSRPGQRLAGSV